MIALLLTLQPSEPSPPPAPPPVTVPVPGDYAATCAVRADGRAPFSACTFAWNSQ